MQFEPSWNLAVIVAVALAALYVWYLASQATIFDRVFAYPREHWGTLWNCPWCLSAWTTAIMLVATGTFDPITWLAAAGLAGILGSHSG